jgi:hypothetical protein
VPTANTRRRREIVVNVEERRAGDVPLEIELASATPVTQIPTAIDELVAHRVQCDADELLRRIGSDLRKEQS